MLDYLRPSHCLLQAQSWFAALPPDRRASVASACRSLSARKGQTLLREGDTVAGWYAVASGMVKLQTHATNGKISTFLGVQAGEWFGEGSVLKGGPHRYQVVAMRDSELLCLPKAEFDMLVATSLSFNQTLLSCMNLRLSQAMAAIEAGRVRPPLHRVAVHLSQLFWRNARDVAISQEELADLSGLSRQTVNRCLNQLAREGLIAIQIGRIRIRDSAGVARLASGDDKLAANALAPHQPAALTGRVNLES